MFAKSLCVLLAVGVVAANPVTELLGVDPNTLFCDTLGEIFLLLPHFTHCTKYFICVHGKEVEQDCPSDLYFDFEKQTCNWPRATKCWLRGEDIEGSGDDSDEAPVHKSAAPAFQPKVDCSNSETASKQVPYQGDCQRFWRCSHGALESAYCSDGLFFNAHKQMCDHEANVNCASQAEDELKGEFIVYK